VGDFLDTVEEPVIRSPHASRLACVCLLALFGCGRSEPYAPVEPDEEQKKLAAELAPLREKFKAAHASGEDYVLVAVLDRNYKFEEFPEWGELTRILIAHREVRDLDDYGFSLPVKEASEDEGQLEGVLGEYFWIDKDGNILFDDMNEPPGAVMVVEWFVPAGVPEATLHFGGNPCLTMRLAE
jgi:hypothetical protein